jgi:hypothetical protein
MKPRATLGIVIPVGAISALMLSGVLQHIGVPICVNIIGVRDVAAVRAHGHVISDAD